MEKRKNITAVLGPKGGVGKSTISANLAIALAQRGKRVIAVDLDFGASNLHAIFGLRGLTRSLSDFLNKRVDRLADTILNTSASGVGIICGGDDPGIANMPYPEKMKLIRHLCALDCDLLILDLAPGTSYNVVDFSIIAHQSLLITTPEVPSLLNVYSFIKSAVFRRLTLFFKHHKCTDLLELLGRAKESDKHPDLKTMKGFFIEARKTHSTVADSAKDMLARLKPLVVVNRVRTEKDARVGGVIQDLLKEYLSIETAEIMTIREDDAVGNAIAKLTPIMIDAPDSPFSADIHEIAARLC